MSATVLAHDDDDDNVHVFDPMGDGPLFFAYFACFHCHSFFNMIYLAL